MHPVPFSGSVSLAVTGVKVPVAGPVLSEYDHTGLSAIARAQRLRLLVFGLKCPHNPLNFIADWKEVGFKGLAELRLNFSRILVNAVRD